MVDTKRLFVFIVFGMFLFSMVGVLAADDTRGFVGGDDDRLVIGYNDDETPIYSGVTDDSTSSGAMLLDAVFGKTLFGEKELLSRIFFAILLAMIVYTVVGTFFGDEHDVVRWVATIAITAISLIAMPSNILEAIRTQYGVMGSTLLTVIPIAILIFFTLKVDSLLVAYFVWLFFTVYYFALFIMKFLKYYGEAGIEGTSYVFWKTIITPDVLPYTLAIIAGIVMLFFVKKFREWLTGAKLSSQIEEAEAKTRVRTAGLDAEAKRLRGTTGIGGK